MKSTAVLMSKSQALRDMILDSIRMLLFLVDCCGARQYRDCSFAGSVRSSVLRRELASLYNGQKCCVQAGGALIGPHALGIIKDVEAVRHLAELGVVFLLFNIGLELSLERLRQMQKYVFGLGSAQVIRRPTHPVQPDSQTLQRTTLLSVWEWTVHSCTQSYVTRTATAGYEAPLSADDVMSPSYEGYASMRHISSGLFLLGLLCQTLCMNWLILGETNEHNVFRS